MTTYGFDKTSAEKIARVVRGVLASAADHSAPRRTDGSGPGSRVALAKLVDVSGNTHKFRFVAGSYPETLGKQTTSYQETPGDYFAHDLCGEGLASGDYVWITDHNQQWWIIEKCSEASGSAKGDSGACCGKCGGGTITACSNQGEPCHNSYFFDIPLFDTGEIEGQLGCCGLLQGGQFVYHDSGCVWKGIELDLCDDVGGASPRWELHIGGSDPWDVELKVGLDTDGDGIADKKVSYKNPYPYCCDCSNKMVLVCPNELPPGCDEFPCELCLIPGPKCCSSNNIAKNLTATISNNSNCPCVDDTEITLAYRAANQDWFGSGGFCTKTIDLTLSCTVDGGGCADFKLNVEFHDACSSGGEFSPSGTGCTCDPLNLPFEAINVDGCCGVASTGATVTIVVTE